MARYRMQMGVLGRRRTLIRAGGILRAYHPLAHQGVGGVIYAFSLRSGSTTVSFEGSTTVSFEGCTISGNKAVSTWRPIVRPCMQDRLQSNERHGACCCGQRILV